MNDKEHDLLKGISSKYNNPKNNDSLISKALLNSETHNNIPGTETDDRTVNVETGQNKSRSQEII